MFAVSVELTPSFRAGGVEKLFDDSSLVFDTRLAGFSTVRSYDVAKDGRFLIVKQPTGTADDRAFASIIVMQNWSDELRKAVPTP